MICFKGVSKSFGSHVAVNELTLEVRRGEIFTLLGRNGAGKTTSLKMLVGLLHPSQGKISINGQIVADDSTQTNRQVGYVPDEPRLYDKLTGREFLTFVGELYGMDAQAIEAAVAEQVRQFQLDGFIDKLTECYSHGMKQRTVFAAAFLHQPTVLVVDEPMVGLDPHTVHMLKALLREKAAEGAAILISTHTLSAAEQIADRIGVMHDGKLIFCGSLEELKQHSGSFSGSLEQLYLNLVSQREQQVDAARHEGTGVV